MASSLVARNAGLLRKLARVSGLVGVALVFLANFLNDNAVATLQLDIQNADVLESDAAQANEASAAGLDQIRAARRISELEIDVARLKSESRNEEVQSIVGSYELYLSTLNSSVEVLSHSLDQLGEVDDRGVTVSADVTKALDDIRTEVNDIDTTLATRRQALADLKKEHGDAESDEEAEEITQQMDDTLGELLPLETDYENLGNRIDDVFKTMNTQVDSERQASASAADAMEALVYLLTAIGGAIAGFGNWLGGRIGAPDTAAAQEEAVGV